MPRRRVDAGGWRNPLPPLRPASPCTAVQLGHAQASVTWLIRLQGPGPEVPCSPPWTQRHDSWRGPPGTSCFPVTLAILRAL